MLPLQSLTCEASPHFYPLKLRTDPGPVLPASRLASCTLVRVSQPTCVFHWCSKSELSSLLIWALQGIAVSRATVCSLCSHALPMPERPLVSVPHSQAVGAIPAADTCQRDSAGLKFCRITSASLSWFPPAHLWFHLTEITTAIPVLRRQDRSLHCFFGFFSKWVLFWGVGGGDGA